MKTNKTIILIFVFFLLLISSVSATTFLYDQVTRSNSATLGTPDGAGEDWDETDGTTTSINNNYIEAISTSTIGFDNDLQGDNNDVQYLRVDFKCSTADSGDRVMINLYDGVTIFTRIGLCRDDVIYYDSGSWESAGSISDNTLYKLELKNINYATDTYDLYLDDVSLDTGVTFDTAVSNMDSFSVTRGSGNTVTFYTKNWCLTDGAECGGTPASERFIITCENETGSSINNCNATIDTTFYSTTNGTINTNLYANETITHNLTIRANNHFDITRTNLNVSSGFTTKFVEYPIIGLYNYITEAGIDSWTVEIDGTNYTSTSNEVLVPFNTTKNIKTFVTDYIQRTVSHNFIDENDSSIDVWQSEISLSFTEKVTGNTLSNWELWDDGSKVAETTGTTTTWYANAGTYEEFTLKSKSSSFPDRSLDENLTVTALDEESFIDSVYLFDFSFSGLGDLRENEAVTVPFNYTLDITENKVGTPEFDLKFYVDDVLYDTIEDVEDGDLITLNLSESYFGEHNLSFKLIDEYNRESNILIDEVNFYGTVITITFLNEEDESIDLVGDSFFSCTGVYPVASTLSPVTYYLDCIPDWYRFTQENSSLTRKITVQAGIYSTNIYLFDGTTDSFVVKPVEVGDMSGQDIYILRNGNVLHAEEQNAQGRIYPMLRVGYEYDVAYKSGDEYIIIGNFIPLDDSIFILFANSYSLTEFDNTFYNDVLISYGFTGSNNSIYVSINDTVGGLTSARLQIYYYNGSYIGSMDSTVTGETDITFLHPLIEAERLLLNETDFKLIIDLDHDEYGNKTLTYYISKSNNLIFNGISETTKIILGLFLFIVVVVIFSKKFEAIGLIVSSSLLMIFNAVNILSFNDVLIYSLGSFFFIIGIFLLVKNKGVMS